MCGAFYLRNADCTPVQLPAGSFSISRTYRVTAKVYRACRFDHAPFVYSSKRRTSQPVKAAGNPAFQPNSKEVATMRFMILLKADKSTEAGVMPEEKLLAAMGKYNEELVKAGVLLTGEGLQPSSKGARVKFSGTMRTVIDGPFAETKELIAGFWMFQVKSKEEAIEWVKRCPNPLLGDAEIEIRQVFEAADFGAEFTPELREQEERIRAQAERLKSVPKA
jgi:hypothetical protein